MDWRLGHYHLHDRSKKCRSKHGDSSVQKVKSGGKQMGTGNDELRALVELIQACMKENDLLKGSKIYAYVVENGLLKKNIYVGTALLQMYAKCGMLTRAQEVFDELPQKDVVSWTALIDGYAQQGLGNEAFKRFRRMQKEGFSPNAVTFMCLLKACSSIGSTEKGKMIHAEVNKQGLFEKHVMLGNALVDMYANCGAFMEAQVVFDKLPIQTIVSWNVLMGGYIKYDLGDKVLHSYKCMQDEGTSPNTVTYICALKACTMTGAVEMGKMIHQEVNREGLLKEDILLGTTFVDMYAKFGLLANAQEVFDELPLRNVVSWTALISGYIQHGLGGEALKCIERMQDEGIHPNAVTFACVLKACGNIGAIKKGEEIHNEVCRLRLIGKDTVLGTALVDMYAKCGVLTKAQDVFDKLSVVNVVSWNALIGGYAQHGLGNAALTCFEKMQNEGFSPDMVTFASVLKACGSIGAVKKGKEIHAEVRKRGLPEEDILGTALVDMYAKCGAPEKAQEVFDKLPSRDVLAWTALIVGYAQHGLGGKALNCFEQMRNECFSPDAYTFACLLKACGSIRAVEEGEKLHTEIRRQGLLHKDSVLSTALVDMYAKCGVLGKAQEVFDELPTQSIVSWNALVAGYVEHGFGDEALKCFEQMRGDGFSPDVVTFICVIKACGIIGAAEKGKELHVELRRRGLLKEDVALASALMDMYAKCGSLNTAVTVFKELPTCDILSWTALMSGYAQVGKVEDVFDLYIKILREHVYPNSLTLLVLLGACSHAGLVNEGQVHFGSMSIDFCITPALQHYTCIVDLFGRAGQFHKAISLIKSVSSFNFNVLLMTLLGACKKWVNVELGRWAFDQASDLDKENAAVYVSMSNIYADVGAQEVAYKVEV